MASILAYVRESRLATYFRDLPNYKNAGYVTMPGHLLAVTLAVSLVAISVFTTKSSYSRSVRICSAVLYTPLSFLIAPVVSTGYKLAACFRFLPDKQQAGHEVPPQRIRVITALAVEIIGITVGCVITKSCHANIYSLSHLVISLGSPVLWLLNVAIVGIQGVFIAYNTLYLKKPLVRNIWCFPIFLTAVIVSVLATQFFKISTPVAYGIIAPTASLTALLALERLQNPQS